MIYQNVMDAFADYDREGQRWEPARKRKSEMFASPAGNWRKTTIGELIHQDTSTNTSGWVGRTSEHELAFFVKSNVRGVYDYTTCEIGQAPRRKALRLNGIEYRCCGGKLYEMAV